MPYNLFFSVMMFVWKIATHQERKSRKNRTKLKKTFLLIQVKWQKCLFLVRVFPLESKKSPIVVRHSRTKWNFLLSVAKNNSRTVENKVSGLSGTMQFILLLLCFNKIFLMNAGMREGE